MNFSDVDKEKEAIGKRVGKYIGDSMIAHQLYGR